MYMLKPLDEIFARDLRVYRRDGWKLDDIIRPVGDVFEDGDLYAPKLPACMTQDRRIGDRHCWIITFDNASQSDSKKCSDLFLDAPEFELNTFRVSSRFECDDYVPTCFPLSNIGIIRHELLRFRYTYARGDWAHTLKDRLEDMLEFELATMAEADRPEGTLIEGWKQYGNEPPMLYLQMRDDFERNREDPVILPDIIEFADHLLHRWYEEFIVKVPNYNDDPVTHRPHVYLGH